MLLEGEFGKDKAKIKTPVVVPPPASSSASSTLHAVSALHFLQPFEPSAAGGAGSSSLPLPVLPPQSPSTFHKLYVLFDHYDGQQQPPPPTTSSSSLPPSSSSSSGVVMDGVGRGGILVYNTADLKARPVVLDEWGAAPGCSAVDPFTQDLVVGRPDAMYFYSEEEGKKGAKVRRGAGKEEAGEAGLTRRWWCA